MFPTFMSETSADAAGLEPANPSVNGRTRYLLRHTSIFLYGQNLHPPTTYSQSHMPNGAYGNRTRRLLLAKQASPHCDLYPIFAGSLPAGILSLSAIYQFLPVFKLNGNLIRISGLVKCIWKMSHFNNLSFFLVSSFALLTFLFISVFCPANIAFSKCSVFHFFLLLFTFSFLFQEKYSKISSHRMTFSFLLNASFQGA